MKSKLVDKDEIKTILKKSSLKVWFRVYYEEENQNRRMKKTKKKYTLNQIGDMVVGIKADLKQVNDRLDYVIKENNLKDLPSKK